MYMIVAKNPNHQYCIFISVATCVDHRTSLGSSVRKFSSAAKVLRL